MGLNNIRPSGFMYTHGPGSILETTSGPVIVEDLGHLFNLISNREVRIRGETRTIRISDFRVHDRRLSRALGGVNLVGLPSNEELGERGSVALYPTRGGIPYWSLCEEHGILYRGWWDGRYNPCWRCRQRHRENHGDDARIPLDDLKGMAKRHAVRFVSACPEGHLQDVPWKKLICDSDDCEGTSFFWNGRGRRISKIWIRCPKCSGSKNLGRLYSEEHECEGWHHHKRNQTTDCQAKAKIQQRGAASLYMPEIISALDISGLPLSVFEALNDESLRASLLTMRGFDIELTPENLQKAIVETGLPLAQKNALQRRSDDPNRWPLLRAAIEREVFQESSGGELKHEEFLALLDASENGSPPPPAIPEDSNECMFRVELGSNYVLEIDEPVTMHVVPIERLRVVHALLGFKREVHTNERQIPSLVPSTFESEGTWMPAMENFGEGLFLHLQQGEAPVAEEDPRYAEWMAECADDLDRHPVHVWWHTLSHLLIKNLGLDSGLSSTAIRERTYCIQDDDGDVRGGVLLYTAQPGGDGTLGGLVGLAKNRGAMSEIMKMCFIDAEVCSNDPLCEESVATAEGAACYACCLTSETSCEHQNKMLDRLILGRSE